MALRIRAEMKSDPLTTLLSAGLLLGVILTAGLCYWYVHCLSQLTFLQAQLAEIEQRRAFVQSVAADAVEYSRRNPAIVPTLDALGIRPRGATNAPAKPPQR